MDTSATIVVGIDCAQGSSVRFSMSVGSSVSAASAVWCCSDLFAASSAFANVTPIVQITAGGITVPAAQARTTFSTVCVGTGRNTVMDGRISTLRRKLARDRRGLKGNLTLKIPELYVVLVSVDGGRTTASLLLDGFHLQQATDHVESHLRNSRNHALKR